MPFLHYIALACKFQPDTWTHQIPSSGFSAAKMTHRIHVYWWTPFLLFVSLLVGVLFSLGHHLFYKSLVNKSTSTGSYSIAGTNYPGQQVNIAIGTAFAFLAKAAFVLAVSTAYYQVFWRRITQDADNNRPPTLAQIDSTFSAPTNIISLLRAPLWFRYPLLFLMALTMWYVTSQNLDQLKSI